MATDIVTREPGASSSKTPKPTASAKRIEPEVKEEPDEEDEDSAGEEEKTLLVRVHPVASIPRCRLISISLFDRLN